MEKTRTRKLSKSDIETIRRSIEVRLDELERVKENTDNEALLQYIETRSAELREKLKPYIE